MPSLMSALEGANLQQFSQGVNDVLSADANAQKQQDALSGKLDEQKGIQKITARADGRYTIETTKEHLDYLQQQLGQGMQAQHQMSQIEQVLQGELSKIQDRENRGSPILNTLATVAANIGMDPRMPPVVRGLSAASAQLNPTPQALTQQKLSILGALEQAQRGQREDARLNFDMQYKIENEQRLMADAARREKREGFSALTSAAGRGEITDPSMALETLKAMDIPEPQAKVMADSLVAMSTEKRSLDDKKQSARDEAELRKYAEQEKQLDTRMAMTMKMFDARQDAAEKKAEKKTEEKRMEVPKTLPDKLQKLDAAEKSLDRVEQVVAKYGGLMGIAAGPTAGAAKAYLDPEVSRARTNMRLEVSQAIQATGAGARGFGPMERGYFEKLASDFNKSPDQNVGVIRAWRDYIRQQRSAYTDAYEGLADPKWKKVFGRDADLVGGDPKDPMGIR